MAVPAALERSRSGRGGHVWLFFAQPVPASLARKLGSYLLTETMERRPDVGLDSYDRLFPNQDTLPRGGFGNLIALPLQKRARQRGNTVFLDGDGRPHADQWVYLSEVRTIDTGQLEELVRMADRNGRVVAVRLPVLEEDGDEPWTRPPSRRRKDLSIAGELPSNLHLVLERDLHHERRRRPIEGRQVAAASGTRSTFR